MWWEVNMIDDEVYQMEPANTAETVTATSY